MSSFCQPTVLGQTIQNPKLQNTFKEARGQIVITDSWNELKVSDKSIEDINFLQKDSKDTKTLLKQQGETIISQQQQIKDLIELLDKNQETIQSLNKEIIDLRREVDNLKNKMR